MIARDALTTLSKRLHEAPAAVLLGPRQVGKTTLALELAENWESGAVYLDLERPADRLRLDDADSFLRGQGNKLVILDEIHRMPGLFEVLRGIIDQRRRDGQRFGQFLLLGSASLDLMQQSSETLAGRVAYVDIGPVHALEWPTQDLDALWLRGGFPTAFWLPTMRQACAGAMTLYAAICNVTCPFLRRVYRQRPSAGCGPCWPTSKAHCYSKAVWPAGSVYPALQWTAILICW